MMCPLLTAGAMARCSEAIIEDGISVPVDVRACVKDKCAWWDGLFKECAIVANGKRGH